MKRTPTTLKPIGDIDLPALDKPISIDSLATAFSMSKEKIKEGLDQLIIYCHYQTPDNKRLVLHEINIQQTCLIQVGKQLFPSAKIRCLILLGPMTEVTMLAYISAANISPLGRQVELTQVLQQAHVGDGSLSGRELETIQGRGRGTLTHAHKRLLESRLTPKQKTISACQIEEAVPKRPAPPIRPKRIAGVKPEIHPGQHCLFDPEEPDEADS